jgi:hypothetical protein
MPHDATTAAAVAAWRATAAVPTVSKAWLTQAGELLAKTACKDPALGSVRTSLLTCHRSISPNGGAADGWTTVGFPLELPGDVLLVVPSPSGELLARVVQVSAAAGANAAREGLFPAPSNAAPALGTRARIDITDRSGLLASITLPTPVYAEGWFEGLEWSPDESSLVVVAEAPRNAPTPGLFESDDSDGSRYEHRPDWGEVRVGMRRSVLVLVELASEAATVLAPTSTEVSAGTPIWCGDGAFIVFSGTAQSAQDGPGYGVAFCMHRSTSLYAVDPATPNAPAVELLGGAAAGLRTARAPTLSADGCSIRFLGTMEPPSALFTHGQCAALCSIDAQAAHTVLRGSGEGACDVSVLIDIVEEVQEEGAFPGLYGSASCHDLGQEHGLLISSVAFGVECLWLLPPSAAGTGPGVPRRLATQAAVLASGVLNGETVLAACVQSPVQPPALCVTTLAELLTLAQPACGADCWRRVWGGDGDPWHGASYESVSIAPTTRVNPSNIFGEVVQWFAVTPSSGPPLARPTVVVPHGGPHSVTTSTFQSSAAFWVQLGYSVCLVNYRGSLSWGQGSIKALRGRCGDVDVTDCAQVAAHVVAEGVADPHRLFFVGGSHSGFIGSHLAGQCPTLFNAFSLRNPVTSASLAAASAVHPPVCPVLSPPRVSAELMRGVDACCMKISLQWPLPRTSPTGASRRLVYPTLKTCLPNLERIQRRRPRQCRRCSPLRRMPTSTRSVAPFC